MPFLTTTNISIIARKDVSATATTTIPITFGVLSIVLAIASLILAYLQLQQQYHIHRTQNPDTLPEEASGTNGPLYTIHPKWD